MLDSFLRSFPYLKPVNRYDLYDRFLIESKGTLLFLYNMIKDQYELHSLKSFMLNGESLQAVIEDDMVSGWILTDYKANDINKFGIEIQGERDLYNSYLESADDRGLDLLTSRTLNTIEKMIGRDL